MANDSINILHTLGAFVLVLALILGFAFLLKRFGAQGMWLEKFKRESRLRVVDQCAIDARHKCVIIQRDLVQHVVLLSPESATLLETLIGEKPRA